MTSRRYGADAPLVEGWGANHGGIGAAIYSGTSLPSTPPTMPRLSLRFVAIALAALVLGGLPRSAAAQLGDAKTITLQAARTMLAAAEAEAKRNGWNVSIAVVDAAGELIGFVRMDDASPGSVGISQAKARTAARMRRPTKALDSVVSAGRTGILSFEGVVAVEGGVPVIVGGKFIGAVGASGATSAQDAQVAKAGVEALRP